MFKNILITSFCFVIVAVSPVFASGDDAHAHGKEDKVKVELATKLNAAWGVKDQTSSMVGLISRELPEAQRSAFHDYMDKVLNVDEIDQISIDALVEVFTEDELEVMLEYYSKDEVKTAEKKKARYNQIIAPKIKTMIDKGMIEAAGELQRLKSIQ